MVANDTTIKTQLSFVFLWLTSGWILIISSELWARSSNVEFTFLKLCSSKSAHFHTKSQIPSGYFRLKCQIRSGVRSCVKRAKARATLPRDERSNIKKLYIIICKHPEFTVTNGNEGEKWKKNQRKCRAQLAWDAVTDERFARIFSVITIFCAMYGKRKNGAKSLLEEKPKKEY